MSGFKEIPIRRIDDTVELDNLVDEVLVSIRTSDGDLMANLLATPTDLEELAKGHVLSESLGYLESILVEGNDIILTGKFRERNVISSSTASCGACSTQDASSIFSVDTNPPVVNSSWDVICVGMERMRSEQKLFAKTGGSHAAALISENEFIIREDIGRHNAVDKVIGAAQDHSRYALLLSSRGGVELVAKACRVGIGLVVCQGAVSAAAAELARGTGMTLVAFCRDGKGVIIGDNSRINQQSLSSSASSPAYGG